MSSLALQVTNLSKKYRIGGASPSGSLRDTIAATTKQSCAWLTARLRGHSTPQTADVSPFWALKDVSFEVNKGEALGIIGRNGAGKSTLLKILSQITEPTTGRVEGYGRVGSLLEVGTGFHPELTGRENVYLNGAILGMSRADIRRRFDEIVTFAGVERFLDTPVKYYSSGMYVRLAFAVAAHLEPEILIIDEVLAVGDAAFQQKCLGKMENVTSEGRTVLFVSHNTVAIQGLCTRAIWLDEGQIVEDNIPKQVIPRYLLDSYETVTFQTWDEVTTAPGNDLVRLHQASIYPPNGQPSDPITVDDSIIVKFRYWNLKPDAYLNLNLQLYNEHGVLLFEAGPSQSPIWRPLAVGLYEDICHIPENLLNNGMYTITLTAVSHQGRLVYLHNAILIFNVHDSAEFREGWFGQWGGAIRPILPWRRTRIEEGA